MTAVNLYLVCFLLGFALSAISLLLGRAGVHPHVHVGHPHGGHPGAAAHAAAAPSPFNFATAMAFLAWFGGAGYLLTRYADLWPPAALLVAIGVGLLGASIVFWVMARVLWAADENLDPDDFDPIGQLAVVCSPIRAGGTGEILYQQAGARRVAGARSENGAELGRGIEVVITRYENGLAYVRTWEEMAGER
jgi:hypothetical protein